MSRIRPRMIRRLEFKEVKDVEEVQEVKDQKGRAKGLRD